MATNVGFDFNLNDVGVFFGKSMGGSTGGRTPRIGDMVGIDIDIDINDDDSFLGYRSGSGSDGSISTEAESDTDTSFPCEMKGSFENFDWKVLSIDGGSGYPKDANDASFADLYAQIGDDLGDDLFESSLAQSMRKKRCKSEANPIKKFMVQTISKPDTIKVLKHDNISHGEQKSTPKSSVNLKAIKNEQTFKKKTKAQSTKKKTITSTNFKKSNAQSSPTPKFEVGKKSKASNSKPKRKRGVPLTAKEKEERATRRRIANREAANRSRMRKRTHLEKVEGENRKLHERIHQLEVEKEADRKERERMEREIARLQGVLAKVNVSSEPGFMVDSTCESSGMPDLSRVGDMPVPMNDSNVTMRTLPTVPIYRSASRERILSSHDSMMISNLRNRGNSSTVAQLTRARVNKLPLLRSKQDIKTKIPAMMTRDKEKSGWLHVFTFRAIQTALLFFGLLIVLGLSGPGLGMTTRATKGLRHADANIKAQMRMDTNLFASKVQQFTPTPK